MTAIMEEWKVLTINDNYEVSNLGKVRNKKTGRILKAAGKESYQNVKLRQNSKSKSYKVHQLVGMCFIENPEKKPQINHKDKIKNNNETENLEWCTAAENNAHKCLTLEVTTNQNLNIWRVDVETDERLQLYNSIIDAANWCVEHGHSPTVHSARGNISYALSGRYKTSCGFKWIRNEQPDLENEVWKNVVIDGKIYDNYQISSLGRFKNSKGVIMDNYKPHHTGYIYVRVDYQKYALQQLVALAFIENPLNKPIVNHIDNNKINNCANNLIWATHSEIIQHSHDTKIIKVHTRKIGQYNLEGELIKEFNSIIEAKNETNISSIKEVLYNKQKTAGGFLWKYLD